MYDYAHFWYRARQQLTHGCQMCPTQSRVFFFYLTVSRGYGFRTSSQCFIGDTATNYCTNFNDCRPTCSSRKTNHLNVRGKASMLAPQNLHYCEVVMRNYCDCHMKKAKFRKKIKVVFCQQQKQPGIQFFILLSCVLVVIFNLSLAPYTYVH